MREALGRAVGATLLHRINGLQVLDGSYFKAWTQRLLDAVAAALGDDKAAKELKKRTLTNLYNQRPTWLDNLHRTLDAAVFAAYGWPADIEDEDILERLLALNLKRATSL